jgi:hypothetical protein
MVTEREDVYGGNRQLSEGNPLIGLLSHDAFSQAVAARPGETARIERLFTYTGRLIDLSARHNIVVLGCGPVPHPVQILAGKGYNVVGVEPVDSFVQSAREYLGDSAAVMQGAAQMRHKMLCCWRAFSNTWTRYRTASTRCIECWLPAGCSV